MGPPGVACPPSCLEGGRGEAGGPPFSVVGRRPRGRPQQEGRVWRPGLLEAALLSPRPATPRPRARDEAPLVPKALCPYPYGTLLARIRLWVYGLSLRCMYDDRPAEAPLPGGLMTYHCHAMHDKRE